MLCINRWSMAFLALVLIGTTLAPASARAEFGSRSNEPFFNFTDFHALGPSGDQRLAMVETDAAFRAAVQPIEGQIQSLRSEISGQLAGSGSVDPQQLASLAQQVFALRAQRDALDMAQMLRIRSTFTSAQLAQVAERHTQLDAVREQQRALVNPTNDPKSAYLPGDLFGDRLGYTRGVTLTAEQSARMSAIMEANKPAFTAIQQQRDTVRGQIAALLFGAAPVTEEQLLPLQRQASGLKNQMDEQRLTMTVQLRALLTPAQLTQAATAHQQLGALSAQEHALMTGVPNAN